MERRRRWGGGGSLAWYRVRHGRPLQVAKWEQEARQPRQGRRWVALPASGALCSAGFTSRVGEEGRAEVEETGAPAAVTSRLAESVILGGLVMADDCQQQASDIHAKLAQGRLIDQYIRGNEIHTIVYPQVDRAITISDA